MFRTIKPPLCLALLAVSWLFPSGAHAQNDLCKTLNKGTRKARCEHRGAGCDGGGGPGTGKCVFQSGDGVCDCVSSGPSTPKFTAVTGDVLSSPIYVNLYWDSGWDSDNPMTKSELDNFTAAIIRSSYFGGLAEYGVGSPSFGGGFLPVIPCTPKPPASVEFYDPVNPSIIGFLQCELDHGDIPQGPQVVYNIILPTGTLEDDLGVQHFCRGGAPGAWHFHQTPYSVGSSAEILFALATAGATAGVGASTGVALGTAGVAIHGAGGGVVGGATGWVAGGATGAAAGFLATLLGELALFHGGPLYTIESADPRCGRIAHNLLHEMIETTSDPYPPPSVILSGKGEIADTCEDSSASKAFVPPIGLLSPNSAFPSFSRFTDRISVPQYWSNASQACVTGYTSGVVPSGTGSPSPNVAMTGNGANISFTITGSGFATVPVLPIPTNTDVPYMGIQNNTQDWQAANSLNSNSVAPNLTAWSDTSVTIDGLNFTNGNLVMQPNDSLTFWVCNPASGKCGVKNVALVESGSPQLRILVKNANNVNMLFDIEVNGAKVAGPLGDGGSTAWLTYPPGMYTVVEKPSGTTTGFFSPRFLGPCAPDGHVNLKPGDNQACTIVNFPGGCPDSMHCCSNATSASGCTSGCIAKTIACQPLCGGGLTKCCGNPLANGKCDNVCVNASKSPPQSCP
jgi:hypothetical protein